MSWRVASLPVEPPLADTANGLFIHPVMYRIVDDDLPPVPDACSEEMRDFLMQCLKKNPAERPRAEMLFEHPWLKQTLGEARVSVPHLGRGCYLSET